MSSFIQSSGYYINFRFRDVFGNHTIDKAKKQFFSDTAFNLTYTDNVIGINGWSALTETYQFLCHQEADAAESKRYLDVRLQLQLSNYVVGSNLTAQALKDKAARDLSTYDTVFYQIKQPDVTATISHTVLTDEDETVNMADLQAFVDSIRTY